MTSFSAWDGGPHSGRRRYCFLMTAVAVLVAAAFTEAQTDTLVVRVCGVTAAGGFIDLTVYKNDCHYLSDDSFVVCKRVAVDGDCVRSMVHVPVILPAGEYAFVVYQDVNSNGTLDENLFGYPTEPIAFSRPFRLALRAPRFNEISFTVNKPRDTVEVRLPRY